MLRTARNVAIILLIALGIAVLPGGDAAARTALNALGMAFLAAMAWFVYTIYRQQQLTLASLSDGRKAVLFGAVGLICLLIAGLDQFSAWGGGAMVAWIALLVLSVMAIIAIWREATTYS